MEHQPAFSRCRARKSGAARSDYALAFRPWMAPAFALWATAGQPSLTSLRWRAPGSPSRSPSTPSLCSSYAGHALPAGLAWLRHA